MNPKITGLALITSIFLNVILGLKVTGFKDCEARENEALAASRKFGQEIMKDYQKCVEKNSQLALANIQVQMDKMTKPRLKDETPAEYLRRTRSDKE